MAKICSYALLYRWIRSLRKIIFDISPLASFIVDDDVWVLDCNSAAEEMLTQKRELLLQRRGGEILQCINAAATSKGCGYSEHCPDCVLRNRVKEALLGNKTTRRKAAMILTQNGKDREVQLLVTATPFIYEETQKVLMILEDISELQTLRELLPTCSHCRKIRDEQDSWHTVDEYLHRHLHIHMSHGICPDCAKEFYPGLSQGGPER